MTTRSTTTRRRPGRAGGARRALLPLLGLCGCAVAPPPHPADFDTATVTIAATGLLPADAVRVGRFGTVVFRNERRDAPAVVTVMRPLGGSNGCSTTLGFAAEGDRAVARGVAAPGFVSLCFHDAGRFGFVVDVGRDALRGTVEVAEADR